MSSATTLKLAVVGVVVLSTAAACVWATQKAPEVVVVREGSVSERIIGRGVVSPRQGIVSVRALVDGRVTRVLVRDGERVKAGQILAELEPQGLDSEVRRREAEKQALQASARTVSDGARPEEQRQLEAELSGARAELALQVDELQRSERLAESGGVAVAALDRQRTASRLAQTRVDTLEARLELARRGGTSAERSVAAQRIVAADAAVHQAKQQLGWTRVTAPIDGVVLGHSVSPGDVAYAGPLGSAMFELANIDDSEVRVEIEEADALRVSVGLPVELHAPAPSAAKCSGTIQRVSPKLESRAVGVPGSRDRADALVRVAWADVNWETLGGVAAVGQRFDVEIRLPSQRAATLVPRSAIRVDDGRAFVEMKSTFGFKQVEVELGVDDGRHIAVTGLPLGATIRNPAVGAKP